MYLQHNTKKNSDLCTLDPSTMNAAFNSGVKLFLFVHNYTQIIERHHCDYGLSLHSCAEIIYTYKLILSRFNVSVIHNLKYSARLNILQLLEVFMYFFLGFSFTLG